MIRWAVQVAQRTCIGARARNEDRVAVEQLEDLWCLVLSDGAGGHGDGERAAQLAVENVLLGFRNRPPTDPQDLSEMILDAHDALIGAQRAAKEAGSRSAMHATAVVLLIDTSAGQALWAHVGDSRLYVWREGRLHSMTRDDSAIQGMLDAGLLDAARLHEIRHRSVLLAALGSAEEIVPHISEPFSLQSEDVFLLCSDGWWNTLEPQFDTRLLGGGVTPDDWLDQMLAQTLAVGDPRQDNLSAIACRIDAPAMAGRFACP
jgi:serine/threonine protein phosphatase PrpC